MQAAAVLPYWCVLIVGFAAQLSRLHLSLPYELRWNEFVSNIQPNKAAKRLSSAEASGMRGTSKRSRIYYYTKGRTGREGGEVSSSRRSRSSRESRPATTARRSTPYPCAAAWCRGSKAKPQFLVVLDCLGSSRAMDLTLTIEESEKDARKRPRELRRQNAKPEKPVHKPKHHETGPNAGISATTGAPP